jgi:squalene synthase HpnC
VADDLADENENLEQSQMALDRWQTMLEECYAGRASHPIFVALAHTIHDFSIPIEPFGDLLVAFRRDQVQRRYETVDELLGYCRYSANPVGRLVLHLGRCHAEATCELSDSICTGLQLANFCQDVARDFKASRIYLPRETMDAAGYCEGLLVDGVENEAFARLMQTEVDRAENYLRGGLPLVELVPDWLAVDVAMFIEGGLEVLREIRRNEYRVLSSRPTVSKRRQLSLLARTWLRRRFSRSRRRAA